VWCQENVGMYVLRPRECFLVVVDDARIGRVRDELVERNGRTAEVDYAPRGIPVLCGGRPAGTARCVPGRLMRRQRDVAD
jgi:hypothetical protein